MKKLIVLTIFVYSALSIAAIENPNDDCNSKGLPSPGSGISEVEKMANALKTKELEKLSYMICTQLNISIGKGDIAIKVENHFLEHLGITRDTKNYKILVSNFWNENSDKLICENEVPGTRAPQHFMKRVVDMHLQKDVFYTFLLYDSEEYPIQVNAVEYYNGKAETFLDYLENILANEENEEKYDFRILKGLKRTLKREYGAKRASELADSAYKGPLCQE